MKWLSGFIQIDNNSCPNKVENAKQEVLWPKVFWHVQVDMSNYDPGLLSDQEPSHLPDF